jgi:hypothetical protein
MSPFMRRIVIPSTLLHLDSSTTVKEAARQLSISVRSLDYLIVNKAFQTRRIGKKSPHPPCGVSPLCAGRPLRSYTGFEIDRGSGGGSLPASLSSNFPKVSFTFLASP